MCKRNILTIAAVAILALATAANAEEMLISANLDVDNENTPREESTLDGPVDGDGGSDVGTTWNQILVGPGMGISVPVTDLVDSTGAATTVVFTTDLSNMFDWGSPDLVMLTGGAFQWVPTTQGVLTFSGLTAGAKYDLYLASFHPNEEGGRALFSTDNTTTTESPQIADNGGPGGNDSTWAEGENYVLFENVVVSGSGEIIVTIVGDSPTNAKRAYLSGFQLISSPVPSLAGSPDPADGATDVCRKVVLSWTPGEYAVKHDVYFGTKFDDVNDATTTVDPNNVYKGRQDPDRYPIADALNLDLGETYYWRIDEVNASPDFTIFKGGIWQFTTEPIAYPIAGDEITATASSLMAADQGPENTINGSGLDANDMHSTVPTDMWLSGSHQPGEAWIEYELDKVYKLHEMWVWNHNSGMEDTLGYGLKDVTIEYSENGADYTTLGTTHEFARAPGEANYEHNTEVYFGVPAKYVKLTANSNWEGKFDKYGLSEVRFFRIPVRPREESPESGTTIDGIDVVLSWRPGREAAEHNVYFSTSFEDVNTGTIAPDIIPAAGECRASYGPLSLDLDKTYYWKVNEVNLAEEPSTWPGDVWNFTTPEYLVVDDMEAYTDRQSIRAVWHDGYVATATSGSNVTVSTESDDRDPRLAGVGPPWPVRGSEAMQFAYDNDGSITLYVPGYAEYTYSANANYYSEIEASTSGSNSLEVGQDWASAKALSLWFYGNPNNDAEQMYVKLNGSKVVYDGDAGDVQQAGWHEWTIALSDFGVDLQNVTTVYIGFGDENNTTTPGGSGVVFFDDIGLYPSRCILSQRSPDFARADYVEDCVVDYKEVEVMAENWLATVLDPITVPNGSFELIYKPGSTTITADLGGGWTHGVGPDTPMDGDQTAAYSDGTDGNMVDVPGWINTPGWPPSYTWPKGCGSISRQNPAPDGLYYYTANGGDWGNAQGGAIESDAPLTTVGVGLTYMLSMIANGPVTPVVLELLANGVALTPSSSVDSAAPYAWEEFSRTYDAASLTGHLGESLTIRVGWGPDAVGSQSQLDAVSLFYSTEPLPTEMPRLADPRVNLYEDKKIDFKDFAELAAWWLDEVLWP